MIINESSTIIWAEKNKKSLRYWKGNLVFLSNWCYWDFDRYRSTEAKGLLENAKASKKGGTIAKNARIALEDKTGKSVVTGENFLPPGQKKIN